MFYDKRTLEELQAINQKLDRLLVLLKNHKIATRRKDV